MGEPRLKTSESGEWKEKKLGDFCKIETGSLDANAMTENGEYNFYTSGEKVYKTDSYAFTGPAITVAGNGNIGITHFADDKFNAYQRTYVLSKIKQDVNYTKYAIDKYFPDRVEEESRGTTIQYIVQDSLNDFKFLMPNLAEQQAIGETLKTMDEMIENARKEFQRLKQIKKASLSVMFPQEGETKPRVRFKGFTDDWEQRKFSDVIEIGSGMNYRHLGEGDIPVYGTGGYMLSVDKALSENKDAVGIGRKGTIDKPYILKAPFWTVDTLFYCIPRSHYDLDFVHCLFQNVNWKSKDESTGVPSLSKVIINNVSTSVPVYEEQVKIGKYFSNLDHLITLHQRELLKLERVKGALLAQMFPRTA